MYTTKPKREKHHQTQSNIKEQYSAYRSESVQNVQSIQGRAPTVVNDISTDITCIRLHIRVVDSSNELDLKKEKKEKRAKRKHQRENNIIWTQTRGALKGYSAGNSMSRWNTPPA